MNKFFATVVSAAALTGSVFADGIEFKLDKPSDWKSMGGSVQWVGAKKDVLQATGSVMISSTRLFDVDVKKKYKLEADVKRISGGAAYIYLGFIPYDKNGKAIGAESVNIQPGSETTVLKAGKVGDTKLILKNNSKWAVQYLYAVALNAKKDYSDLPNRDLLPCSKVAVVNGNLEVTLKKPLAKAVAAGTPVRAHLGGGYMYTGGYKKLSDGQTAEMKGVAKGRIPYSLRGGSWTAGAAKAQVIMLINWGNHKAVTQVKDIELEIEK